MKKIKDNNSGFSLIELIIAVAVLAFLMTAVASLMGSSMMSYKKAKAEINVQNSAQDTYDIIADNLMMANKVVITGYDTAGADIDFSEVGATVSVSATEVTIKHRDELLSETQGMTNDAKNAYLVGNHSFDEYVTTDSSNNDIYSKIYLKKLEVWHSVPLDPAYANISPGGAGSYDVQHTNENGVVVISNISTDQLDECHITYYFEDDKMYVTREYLYMDALNDVGDITDPAVKKNYLFATKLRYVKDLGVNYTGASVTISEPNNSMGIELLFSDKKMTYDSKGMINIRNSYVIKQKN